MQTFEEHLQLNEGLKEIGKKIFDFFSDFHTARTAPDADQLDKLKKTVEWHLSVADRADTLSPRQKSSISGLRRFLNTINTLDLNKSTDRTRLGRIEKDFAPLLKSIGALR